MSQAFNAHKRIRMCADDGFAKIAPASRVCFALCHVNMPNQANEHIKFKFADAHFYEFGKHLTQSGYHCFFCVKEPVTLLLKFGMNDDHFGLFYVRLGSVTKERHINLKFVLLFGGLILDKNDGWFFCDGILQDVRASFGETHRHWCFIRDVQFHKGGVARLFFGFSDEAI